ncbi:MAG: NAD(P)-dependent oxidoreductase [Clostridium sp.]|nr:NAD(P)-dependent oxidoreductase [Clostridium sp.]
MKILVTGASGFIGSFLVEEALNRGWQVWAGMRRSSSKRYLTDDRIRFAELDLEHPEVLHSQLAGYKEEFGGWDYIIHAAGATKCLHRDDFFRTNTDGTVHLAQALVALDMVPVRFVFISSLSVFGAIREQAVRRATDDNPWIYAPITDADTPQPNTVYGESKLRAEQQLLSMKEFPCVILRPTGVYGPREKDYFLMAQSIKQHTDFAVGFRPQEITFVYVRDLVQAAYSALERGRVGKAYFISDGQVYNSRRFSDLLQQELGHPFVLHIKAPLWFLRAVCAVSEVINRMLGRVGTLNGDKYHILSQRNWQCDIEPARRELGYEPHYPLERGVAETVSWYIKEGWL